jgi:hypothetical protein
MRARRYIWWIMKYHIEVPFTLTIHLHKMIYKSSYMSHLLDNDYKMSSATITTIAEFQDAMYSADMKTLAKFAAAGHSPHNGYGPKDCNLAALGEMHKGTMTTFP